MGAQPHVGHCQGANTESDHTPPTQRSCIVCPGSYLQNFYLATKPQDWCPSSRMLPWISPYKSHLSHLFVCLYLETGSVYIALVGLELPDWDHIQRSACFSLLGWVKRMCHHCQLSALHSFTIVKHTGQMPIPSPLRYTDQKDIVLRCIGTHREAFVIYLWRYLGGGIRFHLAHSGPRIYSRNVGKPKGGN